MENLTNSYINNPSKGLITDLNSALVSKEVWTSAINTVHNSHNGDFQFLQNEPSNTKCVDLPYTPIGFIKILDSKWVVFTTDDFNSEIGIFDEKNCSYKKLINDKCLNFNTSNLIRGASKENYDSTESIYWTDGKRNPRRKLNLSRVPYQFTLDDDACKTKLYTNKLDCNELLMTPKLTIPCIDVSVGPAGSLKNGTYQFALAYTINKQRVTDFYSVTSPQAVWSQQNIGQSLVLDINNLDREFDQYELILIYTIDSTSTAKIVGYYPTSTTRHQITNVNKPEYITIPFEEVITKRPFYYFADDVVNNDQYLLWSGVTSRPELNYQRQAMDIKAKWVSYQVPSNYYSKGGSKVGYLRDEIYAFGIQWLYDTGEWSSAFHIPGRRDAPGDLSMASGKDVYEAKTGVIKYNYEIYDTSRNIKSLNISSTSQEKAILEGDMGYWRSTELYPTNTEMFGDDSCTNVRHHKFPSEATAPRYKDGGDYINILGARFENIEHPKDSNGNYLDNIVGYRIVRSDREGNRSVIAKGIFTNVRSYKENINQEGNSEEVLYANYPFNDLRDDTFISSKQTYYRSGERNNVPLKDYKTDQFNFYGPHSLFGNVSLGDEVTFETEEYADVLGYFEQVFDHPKAKVLSNYAFYLALLVGAIDGVLSTVGKKVVYGIRDGVMNVTVVSATSPPANITYSTFGLKTVQETEDFAHGLSNQNLLALSPGDIIVRVGLKILQAIAKAGLAVYFALNTANAILDAIYAFSPFQNYALQYNAHGKFSSQKPIKKDLRRRHIDFYQYLYDGINSVEGQTFNNFKREPSVYVKLNGDIKEPAITDNTRQNIKDLRICDDPYKSVKTRSSLYYGSIKRSVANQYGQLDSFRYVDTGACNQSLKLNTVVGSTEKFYKTDYVFGGDTYISLMSIKRTHNFFRQNIANARFPDGTEYDYTLYRNIGFPRFWLNTQKYDMSEVITTGSVPNRLPQNKFNFDCQKSTSSSSVNLSVAKGQFFYLFNSGVTEFFVESDYNLDYREYKNQVQNFYSKTYSNLTELFRSDRMDIPEEFVYDKSFSKQLIENAIFQQPLDFNSEVYQKALTYSKNRVIYSLPWFKDQKSDNWLVYLNNNYYDFSMSDFGSLTSMHAIDNQQIIFLFDKSSPYVTIGRDELTTDGGVKVTIGDGGLFSREPRPLVHTDYGYGNSQSRWAFVNTQFGSFYPSQRQGRVFNWTGKLEEISRNGMHWWFKNYLPSSLIQDFPNFKHKDNPIKGVSVSSAFDNTDERYYINKTDYKLKEIYKGLVTYDESRDRFLFNSTEIKLKDTDYFDNASWTISYSPKDQAFISWHDWHPSWTLQGEKHFMTIKNKGIWKHNERFDSYCNFYDVDYPWSIEYVVNNGPNVELLRSVEYVLEAGKYFNGGRDFHHILDQNFDTAIVSNSEQISGKLRLNLGEKNKISQVLDYPQLGFDEYKIRYDKEENKIRFNQFFDITKDRGEFTKNNYPLWTTEPNGYRKNITPQAVNYSKNQFQHKRMRHMQHKILLEKEVSADKKFIFKFGVTKEALSER
jgi:hypothetical protein